MDNAFGDASCSKSQPLAPSHDELLLRVSGWLGQNTTSSPVKISLTSELPMILKRRHENTDAKAVLQHIGVIRIDNPRQLSAESKRKLEEAVMPYVCRAFWQDLETLNPKILQEHRDHLTPGDVLFCAIEVSPMGGQKSDHEEEQKPPCPRFISHLLVSILDDVKLPSSSRNPSSVNLNCIVGRVCDPDFQNLGVSTMMQDVALESLNPDVLVTRTMNPAVLKLLRRAASRTATAKIFPNDCCSESDWQLARHIANQVSKTWDHLSLELDSYDADHLVFRNAYSAQNQKVFGQAANEEDKNISFLNPGDAVLRILVF